MGQDLSSLVLPSSIINYILPGVVFAFLLLKFVSPKTPKEALEVTPGSDSISFTPKVFTEKRFLREEVTRKCQNIEIDVYYKDLKTSYEPHPKLSRRETSVLVPVRIGQPIQITYRYKDGFFWTDWSKEIELTIQQPPFQQKSFQENEKNQNQSENQQQPSKPELLSGDLCEIIHTPLEVDIRPLGEIGSGKSSFINTLFHVFTNVFKEIAPVYAQNQSVTRTVKRLDFCGSKICLVDSPGFQRKSNFQIVGDLLKGTYDGLHVPGLSSSQAETEENQEMNQTPGLDMGSRSHSKKTPVLMINAQSAVLEDEVNKKIIEKLIEEEYPCLAVLTHVDKLFKRGESAITYDNFESDPRVVNCCNKLKGLGVTRIFPIINDPLGGPLHPKMISIVIDIVKEAIKLAR